MNILGFTIVSTHLDRVRFRKMMGGPDGWWTSDPTQMALYKHIAAATTEVSRMSKFLPDQAVDHISIRSIYIGDSLNVENTDDESSD